MAHPDSLSTLGPQIRRLRKVRGLTQEALGELPGIEVTRDTIRNWETSDTYPTLEQLYALAGHLRTTVVELLTGHEGSERLLAEMEIPEGAGAKRKIKLLAEEILREVSRDTRRRGGELAEGGEVR